MKVVIDTNVFISGVFFSGAPYLVLQAWRDDKIQVVAKIRVSRIRQIVPLILPLFLISLRRAENLALAMDARAYGYLEQRTSMHEFKAGLADILYLLINITVSLIILYV